MGKFLLKLVLLATLVFHPLASMAADGTIMGSVVDSKNGEELTGATIQLEGTKFGAIADRDGNFKIKKVPAGEYKLLVTYAGYITSTKEITIEDDSDLTFNFELKESSVVANAITVLADRAIERKTPVAFSTVKKEEITQKLGSRDIPMIMNITPSVYATQQGGGAGDARINVRGFDQRNVAIMINGVPVNDMENGWVYWSNWDGIGDMSESIQMQRGLSAVNLATPSIGGTMNILTDATKMEQGAMFKQEIGNGGFEKTTITANTGLIDGKYAISGGLARKTGNGIIDGTWTDAWAYYFAASYQLNPNNRLEFYALGAPQRHGQNRYKQNIRAYSHDFVKGLDDYDPENWDRFVERGRTYNQNINGVNPAYTGKQWWDGQIHERFDNSFINERENYFHKPLVNINWYSQLTNDLTLFTTVYYSGGKGGGTGTYGSMQWDNTGPSRIVDWDATIAKNMETDTARGILRNSVNNQWQIGAISKLNYQFNDQIKTTFGVDWRTAEIDHFREVRDLLGGKYFIYTGNEFDAPGAEKKVLGDKIAYYNTNTVDWWGFFGQAEYSDGPISAYGTLSWSAITYSFFDHFTKDDDGNRLSVESDWISGFQVKGGANYRLTDNFDVFANLGYISKVPIFDNVIDDGDGTLATDPKNEKFTSIEAGTVFNSSDRKLEVRFNGYFTLWKDRAKTRSVQLLSGDDILVFIEGMNQRHMGLELELGYKPTDFVRFDASGSLGDWTYTDDVSARIKDYSDEGKLDNVELDFYIKDLKVGDAPQTQLSLSSTIYPIDGFNIEFVYKYYTNHYAEFDPFSRTDENDRTQSWEAPSYGLFDLHAFYNLPIDIQGVELTAFAHVYNLFDIEYISDAEDNSRFNSFDLDHDADDAEVFFGLPRTFNIGVSVKM